MLLSRPLPISVAILLASAGVALAGWAGSGAGPAQAGAETMPTGPTPAASVSGSSVTVSWSVVALSGGETVAGYRVRRYDVSTGEEQVVGAGCSGTVTALSCTETSVPVGTWRYSVTSVQSSWTGTESAKSTPVTVA